jgi:glycerol-3-phosphate dehydrogenase (NAD(P)+)
MQNLRRKVLILGGGEMSHAMQHLLGARHDLLIWTRAARAGTTAMAPQELVAECDFVLFCLPAQPHHELLTRLLPKLSRRTLCLSIAKGLDEQGRTPADVFTQVLGGNIPHAVLYGPMISEELRAGKPGFAQLAASDGEGLHNTTALFLGSGLHIEASSDRIGIAWSAILKNVYAILFGVADELQLGDNMRGHLAVGALAEIGHIVSAFGGQATTPYRWAGLGDLITTTTSAGSHHHQLGRLLVRGRGDGIRGEGLHTLQMLRKLALVAIDTHPLLNLIETCVQHPDDIRSNVQNYLGRLDHIASASVTRVGAERTKPV